MEAETPELAGLLAREHAIRQETEILRDANIALTQNLSLERVLETLLDFLARLVPYDSANVIELARKINPPIKRNADAVRERARSFRLR